MLDQAKLSQFTGTEKYTRLGFPFKNVVLTDGALYVAEHGGESGAFWLMQGIASHLPAVIEKGGERACFQVWQLDVAEDGKAVLTCRLDTGEPVLARQVFAYTDFGASITLFVGTQQHADGLLWVIMLPSEY